MQNIFSLFSILVLVLLFSTCQNDATVVEQGTKTQNKTETKVKTTATTKVNSDVETGELFTQYFTSEEQEVLLKIKAFYEEGISDGFTFDNIGEAYDYNSGVLRSDLFNKIPHTLTFPYNGKFALSMFEEEVAKLSFITKKCGFQDTKTNEIINYYCPSLDTEFFAYLAKIGERNAIVKTFHDEYLAQKAISNSMKESMILSSSENLELSNFNGQLFYMLFHVFVNEEQKAMEKIK